MNELFKFCKGYIYARVCVHIWVYMFVSWHALTEETQNRIQNTLSFTPPLGLGAAAVPGFDRPLTAEDPCQGAVGATFGITR